MLKAVCTALPIEVSGEFFEVSVGFVVPGFTTVKRIIFFSSCLSMVDLFLVYPFSFVLLCNQFVGRKVGWVQVVGLGLKKYSWKMM